MKQEIDKGTPETQKHLSAATFRQTGFMHLARKGFITPEHRRAGVIYSAAYTARYAENSPRSCLDRLTNSEGGAPDPTSAYWQRITSGMDAASLHSKLTTLLAIRSIKHQEIIERTAGIQDWGVKHVAQKFTVKFDTAKVMIFAAYDDLVGILDGIA